MYYIKVLYSLPKLGLDLVRNPAVHNLICVTILVLLWVDKQTQMSPNDLNLHQCKEQGSLCPRSGHSYFDGPLGFSEAQYHDVEV